MSVNRTGVARGLRFSCCVLIVLALMHLSPMRGLAGPASIIVVDDKEYPPYAFLDDTGTPRGITIDIWKLWSERTGIHVEFRLMEWEAALEEVREGRASAVAGLFRTPGRETFFDFTPQIIGIPTAVFFHYSLGGIRGIQDLTGFNIGVVKGDSAEELVRTQHPSYTVTPFPGARELVQAAASGRIKVFIADSPTAGFYLAQSPEGAEFRQATDLIQINPQHSAVRKGDQQTLALIQSGFTKISQEELRAIEKKWEGRALHQHFPWRQVGGGLAAVVLALGAILLWNLTLRRQVKAKTAELSQSMRDLIRREADYRLLVENLSLIHI